MKGDARVIETLNSRLAEELTAVNQYLAHAEICRHRGYGHLHGMIGERSMAEVKHAGWLIARILFLKGKPIVGKLNIGSHRRRRSPDSPERPGCRGRGDPGVQREHPPGSGTW